MENAVKEGFWSTEISDTQDAGYPLQMQAMEWRQHHQGRRNNLVQGLTSHAMMMLDPNEPLAKRRFKALYECHHAQTCLATSPDGLRWTPWNRAGTGVGGSQITGRAADTYNQLLWDDSTKEYLLHTRTDFGTDGGWREVRGTRTMRWRGKGNLMDAPMEWETAAEWYLDAEGNG